MGIQGKSGLNYLYISCQLYLVYQHLGARWDVLFQRCGHAHNLNLEIIWNLTAVHYKSLKSMKLVSNHHMYFLITHQGLSSEAPHGHSVSLAQYKSKAITVSPASNHVQCFEHFTFPHLLCKLHFQPESHLELSSAQQLPAAPRRLGALCPYTLLSPLSCSTAAGKEMSADPGASCTL